MNDAVGYTLYVGSPVQNVDFGQFVAVRAEAERRGLPVIVWAYPRGKAIEGKGGRDTFYAIDYAERVALELDVDVIKLNIPKSDAEKDELQPKPYNSVSVSREEALRQIVQSVGRSLVIFSGGERLSDEEPMKRARDAMEAVATAPDLGTQRLAAGLQSGPSSERRDAQSAATVPRMT